jgi:hypothetical protein
MLRTSTRVVEPDPQGQVALLLCEALLHVLVERGVITKSYAMEAIGTVEELVREEPAATPRPRAPRRSARRSAPRRSARRALPADLIEAIRASFSAKSF